MARPHTPESFWQRVAVGDPDQCWNWTGCCNSTGYGTVSYDGVYAVAHRVSAFLHGIVSTLTAPKDRKASGFILHQCDNPKCCNPKHFKVGTFSQNQKEAYDRKRRAQPKGMHHANAKLSNRQATAIRRLYATGAHRQVDIAAKYGVSQRVVSKIVRGETYK